MKIRFAEAAPVWLKDREDVLNQMAGFYAGWTVANAAQPATLRITAADAYRVWVNGHHAGYGPARTAHGYARVDEWPLARWLQAGRNHLAIEVLSHGIDSYVYASQTPFLQAELLCGSQVLAATPAGFTAFILPERVQKVERFSKQRPFTEAYALTPDCHAWREGMQPPDSVPCGTMPERKLLPRHVLLPDFRCVGPVQVIAQGPVRQRIPPAEPFRSAARDAVGKQIGGYPVHELEFDLTQALQNLVFIDDPPAAREIPRTVAAGEQALYDFGRVQGGFVGIHLHCETRTRIFMIFDEIKQRDEPFVLGVGALTLALSPGSHTFESFSPYSLRYLRVFSVEAPVQISSIYVREYAHPRCDATTYTGRSPVLQEVFAAGRQTFRTNSIDLFTDCPSRERGGYPCDAWFTAMAERVLTGESRVERNFLENYFLPEGFPGLPEGMVPHCYPSDTLGKRAYIPNWALWLVLELTDYCQRTRDSALQALAEPRIKALFAWFARHHNELGMLEDLPGWIFVEWSPANSLTDGVNHPTNMLYALCLDAAAALYARPDWAAQATALRQVIRETSWDGRWFADQSLRRNGTLQRTEPRTETCQYHALWMGIASDEQTAGVWPRLRDNWGPLRGLHMVPDGNVNAWCLEYDPGIPPRPDDRELAPAGLLYGLLLRFDLLQRYGERTKLLDELGALFGPQARQTGTLWEHAKPFSSCNHGFASCACAYIASLDVGR